MRISPVSSAGSWRHKNAMPFFSAGFDWPLLISTLFLVAVGAIFLWSLSPDRFFPRQLLWILAGFLVLAVFAFADYRIFRNHGGILITLLLVGLGLLLLLLLIGHKTRGVAGWFWVGSVAFEPVEPIKLLLILILAKYFSRRHVEIYQARHLFISGVYAAAPALFVLLQPDLGSVVILFSIWLAMVMFSGIRIRHLGATFLIFLIVAGALWYGILAPYQKARVVSFFNPYHDPLGAGYNAIQAMIAVGSGKIVGKGIGYGTQSHLNFLPEAETDFIFAAIAEETGLLGATILLLLFGFFLYRTLLAGRRAADNFSKFFVLGFSAFVFSQLMVHAGINVGLLPVTGITLPFISYGGSSILTLMAGVGILESIRIHGRRDVARGGE